MGQTLGARIGSLRRKKKWSQNRLAKEMGVNHSLIARYERGDSDPSSEKLRAIASALSVDMEVLLYGEDHYFGFKPEDLQSCLHKIPELSIKQQHVIYSLILQFSETIEMKRIINSLHSPELT